jgi:uncharacterized protein (TIGR02271 family)
MALTVIGVFDSASQAQTAVEQLINAGFSRSNIDLSARTGDYTNDTHVDEDHNSGIGGFFRSLFGGDDDEETTRYTNVASRGSLVTVHAQSQDEAERAADVLDEFGAVDVNERAATYGNTTTTNASTGFTGTDALTTNTTDRVLPTDTDQTIKVVEENLQVGKREVERGGVRVRSRIVERPVEESLRLREERVSIQRTPVNRPATEADLNAFQGNQIEVIQHAEVPVVAKTANVVEEISVGKDVTEREEVIHDTVRKTDVQVDNIDSANATTRTGLTTDLDDDVTYSTK